LSDALQGDFRWLAFGSAIHRWMVATRTSLPFVGGGSTDPSGPYSGMSRCGHASTGGAEASERMSHDDRFDRGVSTTPSSSGWRASTIRAGRRP
jgi:hypothetical protein